MPEAQRQKNVLDLSGGLNTELHDLAWPDGFTTDEANYELLSDGTRKRRRGLADEASAGTARTIDTYVATQANQSYKWKNVNGDPTKAFIVHQLGDTLHFTNDDTNPSASWHTAAVSIVPFSAETPLVAANTRDNPVRFAQGRGHLFVTGPYVKPFYITWDSSGDTFTATAINISYRDFEGIDDGVGITETPAGSGPTTITADHRYNLRNRGWTDALYEAVEAGASSAFPAKNAIWHTAYKRGETTGGTHDPEGDRAVDITKFDAEVFGTSSAPQGTLFLNPFDTTSAADVSGAGAPLPIESWTGTPDGPPAYTVTITITGHPFSTSDVVTISGQESLYDWTIGLYSGVGTASLDGSYTVTKLSANTFSIVAAEPWGWTGWDTHDVTLGAVGLGLALAKSDGSVVERSFEAIAFHAGRVWYAGMADSQFADHLFFSRVALNAAAYGECHQRQDPTDEKFNQLTPTDGGVLVIPGLAGVKDMITVGNSLILIGTEGAWEIAGGRGAVFTATAFGVRQLTNANFNSPTGAITVEDSGIAVGPSGIYQFAPNEFTRQLEAKNIIEDTIQTKWNGFTTAQQQRAQVVYDDAKRRVYFMIGATAADAGHTEMLVFDVRKTAWFRYTFAPTTDKLLSMVAISDADDSSSNQKMKFLYKASSTTVQVADFQQTDYLDFDGLESPVPYLVTGFDAMGDFQRRGQAPIITVYSKRTETGYNANLDTALNPSSTLMTAFWDWTEGTEWDVPSAPTAQQNWSGTAGNHGVSGKIGAQSQVYRNARAFLPVAIGDVDGYPTVVTRNKVRGRGRVLQLRFDGAATFDSHLIGFTTNQKVSRKK